MGRVSGQVEVLIVNQSVQFGGGEVYLIYITEALMDEGCHVTVLFCNEDIPSPLREKIPELGADVIYQKFGVWRPDSLVYNRRFAKLLQDVKPDVIFFNRTGAWIKFSDLIPTARLTTPSRIVVVDHCHPPKFPIRPRQPYRTIRNLLYCRFQARCLHAIICMSERARNTYSNKSYGYPKSRLHVVYNGVDTSRFRLSPTLRETYRRSTGVSSQTLVLYCGRLSAEKGPDILLKAWGSFGASESEELFLVIVGDGGMMKELRMEAHRMGIGNSVHFAGFQEDVLGYLCACDIFVLPSREESFGISLAEAMAVGRYAIATKVGGVPELLTDASKGELIEPDSVDQLARAIRTAANDPARREEVGSEAARHIRENFSLDRMKTETVNVILGEER